MGVNYNKPDKFRSTIFYNVGEPIPVKDFMEDFKENQAKTYNKFLQVLEPKMKELITHIDDKENDELVYHVEELCKKDELKLQGLNYRNLEHDFIVLKQLTEKVNKAAVESAELVGEFKKESTYYFDELKKHKLKDWLFNPKQNNQVKTFWFVLRCLLLILFLPVYVLGLIGNYLPMLLTHKLTMKSIRNIEFYSSIAIGAGMFVFWINYILIFATIYFFSTSIFNPLLSCIVFILAGNFSLYYNPFMKKTFGIYRVLKNKELKVKLSSQRVKLIELINKF
jgi:glycerol-3-phosphate O-acyltransferase / dihydroxyacetone phosphate acyltransferase